EELDDPVAHAEEAVFVDLAVAAPPDAVLGARLAHDELVLGRTAGVLAGVDDERPTLGDPRVAAHDRVLVEYRRRRVPDDRSGGLQAVNGEIPAAGTHVDRRHSLSPSTEALPGNGRRLWYGRWRRLG